MTTSDLDLRLDALRAKDELSAALLDQLKAFLESAPEEELFRMSPLRYAAAHGISEQDAIDLFLHATHVGVLEFAWGVLCPSCVAFLTTPGGLRSLHKGKRCMFCNIEIDGAIDDRVEVAFTVAPSVRRIRFHTPDALDLEKDGIRLYFSSSVAPESASHQALQAGLVGAGRARPGEVHEIPLRLPAGSAVMLCPASHLAMFLRAKPDGPRAASCELLDNQAIPSRLEVGDGEVTLRVRNRTAQTLGYIVTSLVNVRWPHAQEGDTFGHPTRPYLTGNRLVATQAFRDLFRAESIPSEGGLELKAVTVLFTDLSGSTALYERVGDLRAYDLVRKHFAVLRAIAAAEGGSIVKTIGDAVMATFADPLGGMRAALRMNREIATLGEGDLVLRIGLHSGPCIAVELNERLDYFGRTVNIAARVQALAAAGEIVCTEPLYDARGVRASIAEAGLREERATVALKGISGDVPVIRLLAEG